MRASMGVLAIGFVAMIVTYPCESRGDDPPGQAAPPPPGQPEKKPAEGKKAKAKPGKEKPAEPAAPAEEKKADQPAEPPPAPAEEKKAEPPPADEGKKTDKAEQPAEPPPAPPAEEKKPAEAKPEPPPAEEKKPAESKPEPPPAPPPPIEAKPAEPKRIGKPLSLPQARRPGGPWSSYISENGQSAWVEPNGWILDERSLPGMRMIWREPEGKGSFRVVAYARSTTKVEDLVRAMSYGGKPKAVKAWMCAENDHGKERIGVVARPTENGDYLILILQSSPETWKKLGGLAGLRKAADGTSGFYSTVRPKPMPGD